VQVFVLVTVVVLGACGSRSSKPAAEPQHNRDAAAVVANGQDAGSAAGDSMITDEECVARGGKIVTEQTYAHLSRRRDPDRPVHPFRVCRIPSPKNNATCRGESDCAGGRCYCTGALARPNPGDDPKLRALDGTPGTGQCSDEPVESGSWFCLVEGGKIQLSGIIID
jgi:hypothetical protein